MPASMGSRDVVFQKKMEKSMKRKSTDEMREANAREKWNREIKVSSSLDVCVLFYVVLTRQSDHP